MQAMIFNVASVRIYDFGLPRHCEEGGLPDEAISWPWCGIASQRALAMTEQVVDI